MFYVHGVGKMKKRDPSFCTVEELDGRSPEELLAIAVLSRAIRDSIGDSYPIDLSKKGRNGRLAISRSAESWFYSTSTDGYSFRFICEVLSIDPLAVLRFRDALMSAPDYYKIMSCNVKEFQTEKGERKIRTRTEYLIQLTEGKKKAPKGAD